MPPATAANPVGVLAEPFPLRIATPRPAEVPSPVAFSPELDVWVVEDGGGERPIVEVAGGSLTATQTKTMTHTEADGDVVP